MTFVASDRSSNLSGSIWMIASMAGFAMEDSFVKGASAFLPTGQILILFGSGGACLFAALALFTGQRLFVADVVSSPMRIRVVFEIVGRLFYTLSLALIPLSTATVILQATPIFVIAGAALVFQEAVGWRRWAAIVVGSIGVLTIVQPGTEGFSLLSLLAVLGMLGFAGRDLASRAAPRSLGTTVLGFYGFLAIVTAGILFSLWQAESFVMPGAEPLARLSGAIVVGVAAYSFLMRAMRTGDVSAVTPFRYTRLLFGISLGLLFFGERLSLAMVVGSCLIVLSGLFIVWRGKQLAMPK